MIRGHCTLGQRWRSLRMFHGVAKLKHRISPSDGAKPIDPKIAHRAISLRSISSGTWREDDQRSFSSVTRSVDSIHGEPTSSMARLVENGSAVVVSFDADTQSTFHAPWLWSNDPSFVHSTSGQRLQTPGQYRGSVMKHAEIVDALNEEVPLGVVIPFPAPPIGSAHPVGNIYDAPNNTTAASNTDSRVLRVTWEASAQMQSTVSYYDLEWLQCWRYDEEAITRRRSAKASKRRVLRSDSGIFTLDYRDLTNNEEDFCFQLLNVSSACCASAKRIGLLVHTSLCSSFDAGGV